MIEEIFGPILPVINVRGCDEAVAIMHKFDSPLALYVFGKNRAVIDRQSALSSLSLSSHMEFCILQCV